MSESLVRVSVPVFAGVVPGQVHLAPFAVDLYGVPGMAVALGHFVFKTPIVILVAFLRPCSGGQFP